MVMRKRARVVWRARQMILIYESSRSLNSLEFITLFINHVIDENLFEKRSGYFSFVALVIVSFLMLVCICLSIGKYCSSKTKIDLPMSTYLLIVITNRSMSRIDFF
jgi:hypothetical protein